jgi:tetratricopeptide (TPR) repeat protein
MAETKAERDYEKGIGLQNVGDLLPLEALGVIGSLINASDELERPAGLERARKLGAELLSSGRLPDAYQALLHQFLANACAGLRRSRSVWLWESEEMSSEFVHLRRALDHKGFAKLRADGRCRILTNLGNSLSSIGRVVEAIPLWRSAIHLIPDFGMALANLGEGLITYGNATRDPYAGPLLIKEGVECLQRAIAAEEFPIETHAVRHFETLLSNSPVQLTKFKLHEQSRRDDSSDLEGEKEFRDWCSRKSLYLSFENDLEEGGRLAVSDNLNCLPVTGRLDEEPNVIRMFDQLVQEYVAARFLLYEAQDADRPSIANRNVRLHETLDYALYGYSVEETKIAFRICYSLFDKIAFLINDYLGLGLGNRQVSFGTVWFGKSRKKKVLAEDLDARRNWPLRGLFWVSRDFYEVGSDRIPLDPDAKLLFELRNVLEHRFLRLHSETPDKSTLDFEMDHPIRSMSLSEFSRHVLHLFRRARAAIIYVAMAIRAEELAKRRGRGDAQTMPVAIQPWRSRSEIKKD